MRGEESMRGTSLHSKDGRQLWMTGSMHDSPEEKGNEWRSTKKVVQKGNPQELLP